MAHQVLLLGDEDFWGVPAVGVDAWGVDREEVGVDPRLDAAVEVSLTTLPKGLQYLLMVAMACLVDRSSRWILGRCGTVGWATGVAGVAFGAVAGVGFGAVLSVAVALAAGALSLVLVVL